MAEIASAFVTIAPSAKGFGSSLNKQVTPGVASAGSSLGRTFGKLFVLGAGVIAAAGIGKFLKGSIDEAREAQQVGAQTAAVIKSTGSAAGLTAKQFGTLATAISNKVGIDDEQIQSAENVLATFTSVRNEVGKGNDIFNQATQTITDMSVALGTDMKGSTIQVGKALNDPIKGITALTRVGVSFTDQQKDQIKSLVDSGQTMKAQKIILGELSKEFGGSAAAQATAGQKASVAFGNIKESIGTALLPALDSLENAFTKHVAPAIQNMLSGASPVTPILKAIGRAAGGVAGFIGKLADAFSVLFGGGSIDTRLDRLADELDYAFGNTGKLAEPLGQAFGILSSVVTKAVDITGTFVAQMKSGQGAGGAFVGVLGSLASVLGSLLTFISNNKTVVATFAGVILTVVAAVKIWTAVQAALDVVLAANPIGLVVIAIAALAAGLVYAYKHSTTFAAIVDKSFSIIKKVVTAVIGFVVPFVKNHWLLLVTIIGGPLALVVAEVIKHFGTVKKVVGAAAQFVLDSAKKYAQFVKAVIDKVGEVVKFFKQLPGKIKGFMESLPGDLKSIGVAIVSGLAHGISAAAHWVYDAVQRIIDNIPKKIRDLMHINSPAKTMIPLGSAIPEGLAVGMREGAKHATDAAGDAVDKVSKKVKERVAKLRDQLSSVRDDFASLVEPIASNFTQGLFDFDTASAFTANLTTVKGTLTTLLGNFKTLIAEGLSPGFLYQLFQSGGPGLINSLAGLDKAGAQNAASLFGQVTDLSNQLGTQVAAATDKGAALENQTVRLERKLDHLIAATKKVGADVGDRVNGAAANGHRRAA